MRFKPWAIAGGALAVGAAAAWFALDRFYPAVELATAATGPAVQAVYATGVVEPVQWAKVGPTQMGRITAMLAAEGDKVAAGAVLARQDDREAKARVAELEARAVFLDEQLRRYTRLRETGTASQQAFDQANSELQQVRAALVGSNKRLADLTLRAPLAGTVLRKDGEVGETAREGQVLYWVGATDRLWITADIDEDDIPLVKAGQQVLIRADAFPGQVLTGRVAEITPKGDPIARSYRARVTLGGATDLRIGMTTEVNIVVSERQNALLIPARALKGGQVFIYRDGRAMTRAVRTGIVAEQLVEISDGIEPGEQVILDPPAGLADGAPVRRRGL